MLTPTDLTIIGSGPAGISAAMAYRDHGGSGRVVILSSDEHPPYERPPLSKEFLRGESEIDDLWLEEAATFRSAAVEIERSSTVVSLDVTDHTLTLSTGRVMAWGSVVIATGNEPSMLPVEGGDHPAICVLRSLRDAQKLRSAAEEGRSVVIVGSGFIGCEAAASLAARGLAVTMVTSDESPQAGRLGDAASSHITGWLEGLGVILETGREVSAIHDGRVVQLADGTRHEADVVVVAVGVTPRLDLARRAGLDISEDRIAVDAHMRTSALDVYAAGDVVHAVNATAGRRLAVEHWGDALAMGEVAGATVAGADASWAQVPGFWSEIGDHTLKYAAWGDGHDATRFVDHGDGAFTVWYSREGRCVGVLTHRADDDYDAGTAKIERDA